MEDNNKADLSAKRGERCNMGSKYTEAQKRATANYMEDKHTIRVVVTKEEADRYKKAAKEKGYPSLNKFIIDCIKKEML